MKRIAISVGDLNGIGIEIALRSHNLIKKEVKPIYCIDSKMLNQASKKLGLQIPQDFQVVEKISSYFEIEEGVVSNKSGAYSFNSFLKAIDLVKNKKVDMITTLPIHKKAWELAGVKYKGHTDALRDIFKKDAIMMLGVPKMFVALFTEHIPLKEVTKNITKEKFSSFLEDFYNSVNPKKEVAVLGVNPHSGDNGVLGDEENILIEAINEVNNKLKKSIFTLPIVPDIAFTPKVRENFNYFIAIYHDQGLAPLKALYFEESINISLNLPILRTSVDHGTAFDIAYKNKNPNNLSYINAIKYSF